MPFDVVRSSLQRRGERPALFPRLKDKLLDTRVDQRVAGRALLAARHHGSQLDLLRIAQRVTKRVSRGLEGLVRWRTRSTFCRVSRLRTANDAEVVKDRVVPAQERLPRPQRVTLEWCVVIGVADHHLAPIAGRRVAQPVAARLLFIIWSYSAAWRNPVGRAIEERCIHVRGVG